MIGSDVIQLIESYKTSLEDTVKTDNVLISQLKKVADHVRSVEAPDSDEDIINVRWDSGWTSRHPAMLLVDHVAKITETVVSVVPDDDAGSYRNTAVFSGLEHDVMAALYMMELMYAVLEDRCDVNRAKAVKTRLSDLPRREVFMLKIQPEWSQHLAQIAADIVHYNMKTTAASRRIREKRAFLSKVSTEIAA